MKFRIFLYIIAFFCAYVNASDNIVDVKNIKKFPFLPHITYSADDKLCAEVLQKHMDKFFNTQSDNYTIRPLEWKTQKYDEYSEIEKAVLSFPNNITKAIVQIRSCCLRSHEMYQVAIFDTADKMNFAITNASNEYNIAEKGLSIYPDSNASNSARFPMKPFIYQSGYYFEYIDSDLQNKISTMQILESGQTKTACTIKTMSENNILLKIENFKKLIDILEAMWSSGFDCGSFPYSYYHEIAIAEALNKMAYSPWQNFDKQYLQHKALEKRADDVPKFLEKWSFDGFYNYELYQQYLKLKEVAYRELVDYYKVEFLADNKTAKTLADHALKELLLGYFNSFSSSYLSHAYQAQLELKKALLRGANTKAIEPLLTDDLNTIKDTDVAYPESMLFFSLKYPKNVKLLIDKGANVNQTNGFGKTALMYAAQYNLLGTAKVLLKSGADVNAATKIPQDLYLVSGYGCNVYRIFKDNVTALHYAARYADLEFIKLLLNNKADKNAKDSDGKTPYDWLEIYKNPHLFYNFKAIRAILKPQEAK